MGEAAVRTLLSVVSSFVLRSGGRLELSPEDYSEGAEFVEDLVFEETEEGGVVVGFRD